MAEGFEPFHVPQQSRRDKLRVVLENQPNCQEHESSFDAYGGLLPSLIPSHMLEGRTNNNNNNNNHCFRRNPVYCVKQEGRNSTMGYYVGGFVNSGCNSASSSSSSSSSSSHHHHYSLDPQPALPLNINYASIHDINNTPNNNHFLYTSQTHRDFDLSSTQQLISPSNTTTTSAPMYKPQALSLSLSSQHQQLHLPRPLGGGSGGGVGGGGGASTSNDIRSSVPLGPFTGYASILKGSRFLIPAQQLLEDFCHVGQGIYVERNSGDSSSSLLMDSSMENFNDTGFVDDLMTCSDGSENRRRKTRLISLLEEVYRRYKVYYQQMQAIIASFESVAGLSNAAPYTSFALKAMSKHFRSLKNAITDQLRFSSKSLGEGSTRKDGPLNSGAADVWVHEQRTAHNPVVLEPQPIWRPQRGLPERAVAVLKAWLFEHFLHPYPTDTDKQTLAKQTGLSRSQVSNWFINARVRLWKPMVEEIHMLETCQSENTFGREDQVSSKPNEPLPLGNPSHFGKQRQVKSAMKGQDNTSKRSRSELPSTSGPMNFTYNTLSSHNEVGSGLGSSGGNNGVSLTLGLQQNNGIGFSEALPMNIARRFGLEASNEGYIGSFEAQNHHFSRDLGGRLLRDYVG